MPNFYFTFGSHPAYPYGRNQFVQVVAPTIYDAVKTFQAAHPNRPGSRLINCADYYDEEIFNKFRNEFYPGTDPVEVLTWQG